MTWTTLGCVEVGRGEEGTYGEDICSCSNEVKALYFQCVVRVEEDVRALNRKSEASEDKREEEV